ncbi:hypothetical protein CLAFUW4_20012 [Fulvia fulva]|uniref:uncharacterized protein n=1 Tax=Passalora fulva TaxID=5499 RepID=UPI002852AC41|nr:uncharacterized protein CLAFUR5_20012 [Fulvia fulva]KAK4635166.1 hypothetical protein CLAFUR4_20012 [Fulvia fulva]KAK4638408.1 hypothetical protein CLAFUR0_20012 [Fulvia fulva]WMI38771.1 hypothetical protein CLAFUR5_20012 [Fulvia fulva]WPV09642.1 hypothetical protein CLAFUW4_20012 [Fulvia fulva]WPV23966.1 hypothetical protein CLAFUW7_20012 [Fulvia fulva]
MRLTYGLVVLSSQALILNIASASPLWRNEIPTATSHPVPIADTQALPAFSSTLDWTPRNTHQRRSLHQPPSTGSIIGMPFRTPLQLEHEAQTRSARDLLARTAALLLDTSRSDVVAGLDSLNTRTVQRLADAARRLKARVDASIPREHLVDISNSTMTKRDVVGEEKVPTPNLVRLANKVLSTERRSGSLATRFVDLVRRTSV